MASLLNNPWVIGIGGGVLSGFLVTWLSRYLFSSRDKKEYVQNVASVNREVISAVRSLIPDDLKISLFVISSLISATCRKYNVEEKDVYDVADIAEDIIKEVLDSSFISNATKEQYCEKLLAIKNDYSGMKMERRFHEIKNDMYVLMRRTEMSKNFSRLLGSIVAVMTLLSTLVFAFERNLSLMDSSIFSSLETVFPILATALSSAGAVLALSLLLRFRDEIDKKKDAGKINKVTELEKKLHVYDKDE